jgi:hypothetical protein
MQAKAIEIALAIAASVSILTFKMVISSFHHVYPIPK